MVCFGTTVPEHQQVLKHTLRETDHEQCKFN